MEKVLLIVPLSTLKWGAKNAGGVDSVCQMLVKYLAERNADEYFYRVLAFDPQNKTSFTGNVIQLSENVDAVVCPTNEKRAALRVPGFLSASLRVKEQVKEFQPDIVHSHMASWLLGVSNAHKRIATLHSYKTIGRKSRSWANNFFYTKIMPWLSQQFIDRYTCVGEILEESLRADTRKPIVVIGNPIDESYFISQESSPSNNRELRLVTCALISRRKRIDLAINLISAMKKKGVVVSLRVIGPNADAVYFSELQQQVTNLGLVDNVEFIGALNKPSIIKEYQHADIAVFFSEQETFGLAPLEALASGLPLLTTAVGILSERKNDFERLGIEYINEVSIDSQLEAIERLKSADMSRAVEYIKNEFTAESVVSSYERLYREFK